MDRKWGPRPSTHQRGSAHPSSTPSPFSASFSASASASASPSRARRRLRPLFLSLLFVSVVGLGASGGRILALRWMRSHSGLAGSFLLNLREASMSDLEEEHFPSGTATGNTGTDETGTGLPGTENKGSGASVLLSETSASGSSISSSSRVSGEDSVSESLADLLAEIPKSRLSPFVHTMEDRELFPVALRISNATERLRSPGDPSTPHPNADLNTDSRASSSLGGGGQNQNPGAGAKPGQGGPGGVGSDPGAEERARVLAREMGARVWEPRGKVAFLWLTMGVVPLAPLWSRFFHGHQGLFSLYVHAPGELSVYNDNELPPVFAGRRVPGQMYGWGHISVVEAERRLLASALLDPENKRFVLLSDSCIPLFNFTFVYNYLMGTNLNFVKGVHVGGPGTGTGHWNADFLPLITIRQWVNGATWFTIDRQLARYIIQDFRFLTAFARACEFSRGCFPEDHYVQTILHMYHGDKLINRTLTWVDWSGGGVSSALFTGDDVKPRTVSESLVLRLGQKSNVTCAWGDSRGEQAPCYLFARQFQPNSVDALLALAPELGIHAKS